MEAPPLTADQLALLIEVYAAGRADATCGRYVASSLQVAELLETIHTRWMDGLCRVSAGLLPFDDTHDLRT